MRINPLVTEVLRGLARPGQAHLDHLGLLLLQGVVVLLWWPRDPLTQVLESQSGPNVLTALVMAFGATAAYLSLRIGAEEVLLPGQHGLRDWTLATPLGLGRILHGYVLGQLLLCLYLLALASPLLLMAFTVSGGEWPALAWCLAAALLHSFFYRLCGAIVHFTIGQHRAESRFFVRAILIVVYVPVGFLLPFTSHVVLTSRALGEGLGIQAAFTGAPEYIAFLVTYCAAALLAASVLYALLLRARLATPGPHEGTRMREAVLP
jgi:hypothetical protein